MARPSSDQPRVHVLAKRVWVELPDSTEIDLMHVCLERSKLLRNICDTVVPPWEAELGIDITGLLQWLQHVQPDHASPLEPALNEPASPNLKAHGKKSKRGKRKARKAVAAAHAKQMRHSEKPPKSEKLMAQEQAMEFCILLQAADILMDERTEAEACSGLAAVLGEECDSVLEKGHSRKPLVAAKVLAAMSEDLVLKVLQSVQRPFSNLLQYLSTTPFRPHLLRAHHPSIDAHASLSLRHVFAPDMPFVLHPMATLTHLQSLSFEGTPLVHLHAYVIDLPIEDMEHMLRALPRLTHLSLRDTALRACTDALAAALPALPHLHTLDASGNRLDGAFAALAAALPAATALRTLLLDGAVATAPALRALAAALWQLPRLETLSIGAPCYLPFTSELNAFKQGPPFEYVSTAYVMHEVLAPMRSMGALRSLDFTYKLLPDTSFAIAPAVASLTQLHHLRLRSLALCNLSFATLSGTQRDTCMREMHHAVELSPTWIPAPVGSGMPLLCGLTSLDLSQAASVPSAEVDIGSLIRGLGELTQLQRLQLPRAGLCISDCESAVHVFSSLTSLTMIEVQAMHYSCEPGVGEMVSVLADVPHLQHMRVPLILECWNGSARARGTHCMHANAAAAVARAAAEKVVQVDLQCYEHGTAGAAAVAAAGKALSPLLPLCCSLRVGGRSGAHLQAIASAVMTLTNLTRLRFEVDGEDWNEGGLETGHQRLVQGLGLLSSLESLAFSSNMTSTRDVCEIFCDQLTCLRRLTNLELGVRGVDNEFVPAALEACRRLPCLRRLSLRLLEEKPMRENGRLVFEPEWWFEAWAPEGWAVGGLTALQTLLVFNHGNLEGDEPFWEGLFQLSRLQSLHLHDDIDDQHLKMLMRRLRDFGGMALQELHVDRDPHVVGPRQAWLLRNAVGERVALQRD